MSPIIEVRNLSKKFVISHEGPRETYRSLRDVIADRIRNVWHTKTPGFTREDFWALKDLTFEVKQGDRLGIIGRNGAGKSTLLKVLSRITEPTSGSIHIRGRVASLLEVGTGFHPELSGRENIYLNGAILGMSRREVRSKFDEIVAFAEVERFLDTPVKRYSSGMYVRLAFAVAAHLDPEILIVDEVLAVGDAQFQKKCLGKMEDVSNKEGRTVLFVSHNMGALSLLCNSVMVLNHGEIAHLGNVQEGIRMYNMIGASGGNDYVQNAHELTKIQRIEVRNEKDSVAIDFENEIHVRLISNIAVKYDGLHIGVALLDKWKRKIFTSTKEVVSMTSAFETRLIIPRRLLLNGDYSVDASLFVPNGPVLDYVTDVCSFSVVDSTSNMAIYGLADVGVVHIESIWK